MIAFPAFCPNCGAMFASAVHASDSHGKTLWGVRQSCPRCGAWAELPDGTFNVVGDAIEVLSAPSLTRERLEELNEILKAVQSKETSPSEALDEIAESAPELRTWIERYGPRMRMAMAAFLWSVFQILLSQLVSEARDDSASPEEVQKAIEKALDPLELK